MEKDDILQFVRQMKPRDHVIMFYSTREDKREVLFNYLKAGLDQGEVAAYVVSEEKPDEIRQAMRRFSMDVGSLERSGALHVIDYENWYIIGGEFSRPKTMELWKRLLDESMAKGFKGLRAAGEMAGFFEKRMVRELVEYEKSLHKVFELPMAGICAYDSNVVANEGQGELFLDLIKAHGTVIIVGPEGGVVKSQ